MRLNTKRTKKRLCLSRGFTVIESLVGILILGTLFTSLYAGITYGFSMISLSRENLRATQILLEKMETLRLYNWDQINSNGFMPTNFTAAYDPTGSGNSVNLMYTGSITIAGSGVSESYSNEMRKVQISVDWSSSGVLRTRSMETFVAENGLQKYIY